MFHLNQRRDQLAELVGQIGVAVDQLGQRGPLAAAQPLQERLDDRTQAVVFRGRDRSDTHGRIPEAPPGRADKISLSRFKARM